MPESTLKSRFLTSYLQQLRKGGTCGNQWGTTRERAGDATLLQKKCELLFDPYFFELLYQPPEKKELIQIPLSMCLTEGTCGAVHAVHPLELRLVGLGAAALDVGGEGLVHQRLHQAPVAVKNRVRG